MPERHQVKLVYCDGGLTRTELACPEEGCEAGWNEFARADTECWIKSWADNEVLTDYMEGEVTVEVEAEWTGESPLVKLVGPVSPVVSPETVETLGHRVYEELCNRELLADSDEERNVLDVVRVALAQESPGGTA